MKIIIVTTDNEVMKETGFGAMDACIAVESALKLKYEDVAIKSCDSKENLKEIVDASPDLVVLACKYIEVKNGKKIWLSKYFDEANITYTGSTRKVLEYSSNKVKAKKIIHNKGIKTAEYSLVTPENYLTESNLNIDYPLFMKPLDAANGNGIDDDSIINNHGEFVQKAGKLFSKYGDVVIAEKYLNGREFTVSVVYNTEEEKYHVSPLEIIPPKNKNNVRILGEKVKRENSEAYDVVNDDLLRKNLTDIAIKSFKSLGVRDFGRFDIKLDEDGVCHFMEANLVPGMTLNTSYFPVSFEMDTRLKYSEIVNLITNNAIRRSKIDKRLL